MNTKSSSAAQSAYDALSVDDKEAIDTFIYGTLAARVSQWEKLPDTIKDSDKKAHQKEKAAYEAFSAMAHLGQASRKSTELVERYIEDTREQFATHPELLESAKSYEEKLRKLLELTPSATLPIGKHTQKVDALIELDGDQYRAPKRSRSGPDRLF